MQQPPMEQPPIAATQHPDLREQRVAGTTLSLTLAPIKFGAGNGGEHDRVIWMSTTEVTWDLYDAFVYGLDEEKERGADAVTKPSKPYIAMDRGFGRAGYPAISMSHHGAIAFCEWLSKKTGRTYRLPTLEEWRTACAASEIRADEIDQHAWHRGNAGGKTHPVAMRRSNDLALHDLLGNAAEWVTRGEDEYLVVGGSYQTPGEKLSCDTMTEMDPDWNASDPQIPKSRWWLADAGFIGFRVVCEDADALPREGRESATD